MKLCQMKSVACLIAAVMICGCDSSGKGNLQTGESYNPVDAEMLTGALYTGRTGGTEYDDLQWTFGETSFEIIAGAAGMPTDITETLLPEGITAERITGSWSVDGETLTLSEVSADGTRIDQPAVDIRTMCTPVIRIQPQSAQYMFRRGTPGSGK